MHWRTSQPQQRFIFTRKTVKFKTSPIDSKRGELELHMTKKKRKKQCCELRFPQSRTHTQHYLFGFLFVICESNPRSLESIDLVLKSIVAIRKILQCMNEVEFMLTTNRVELKYWNMKLWFRFTWWRLGLSKIIQDPTHLRKQTKSNPTPANPTITTIGGGSSSPETNSGKLVSIFLP